MPRRLWARPHRIAGFVLSLIGFGVLGLILSWVGLSQAKREDRSTGLCVAGIVIGAVDVAITILIIVFWASFIAALSSSGSGYAY